MGHAGLNFKSHREQYKKVYLWPWSLEKLYLRQPTSGPSHSHWCHSQISKHKVILARMDIYPYHFVISKLLKKLQFPVEGTLFLTWGEILQGQVPRELAQEAEAKRWVSARIFYFFVYTSSFSGKHNCNGRDFSFFELNGAASTNQQQARTFVYTDFQCFLWARL